jgi:signal transduction histidine kinase
MWHEKTCKETVMAKAKCVVVPDLTKDARFCNNVTVLNPPYSRFYASVPLMSPEGFKLGTLCIIDTVVRPHGLSTDHVKILCDLADTTVKVMVDRRALLKQQLLNNDPMHILSSAAHDMLTPLDGIRLSLSNLKDDDRVRSALDELQFEKLTAAARSSDLVIRMCRNALRTAGVPNLLEPSCAVITTTRLDVLVKNLRMVMDPMPKKVPIIISLDQGTPNEIVANESQLFRAALNILVFALGRTESGTVHLTIKSNDGSCLSVRIQVPTFQ